MFFNRKKKSPLYRILKKKPGHMYVTDTLIAVMFPDDTIMCITGNFKNITEEEANLKLQKHLADITK